MAISNVQKVVVVGLDGATFDLIKPWVAEGKLPNLANYFYSGCHGSLQSTILPSSPQAWASFQTGMNPGKHGIFDFRILDLNTNGFTPISTTVMNGKPFWRILSESGRKVTVINLLPSYPPSKVNGILITCRITPWGANYTFPPELAMEIETNVGPYIIEINDQRYIPDRNISQEEFVQKMHQAVNVRAKTAHYLLDHYDWDLFLVVFTTLDAVQHFFWKHADLTHPEHTDSIPDTLRFAVLNVYQQLDTFLGELESRLGSDTTFLLVSDHGFGPLHGTVNLNRWLYEAGLQQPRFVSGDNDLSTNLKNAARRILPQTIRTSLKRILPANLSCERKAYETLPINWAKTRAYSWGDFGNIFINVRGREPLGIVDPGKEYERLREQIAYKLTELTDPVRHQKIIRKVHKREELYHGPRVMFAPDLIVQWSGYTWVERHSLPGDQPLFPDPEEGFYHNIKISGMHREAGILLAKGPAIRKGFEISGARIIDLAPTLLYLMGQSIPSDMDGQVLTDLFETSYLDTHPSRYENTTSLTNQNLGDGRAAYSIEEAAQVAEVLKRLGYM